MGTGRNLYFLLSSLIFHDAQLCFAPFIKLVSEKLIVGHNVISFRIAEGGQDNDTLKSWNKSLFMILFSIL